MTGTIEILYEDEFILGVNKPNNVLVHHSHYARNITDDSLLQLLKSQQNGLSYYPINRLDRKTSGVVLLSKQKSYVSQFQELFDLKEVNKVYQALVRGHVLEPDTIDSPVKNDRGNYKGAISRISPLQTFEIDIPVQPYPTARYTLLEMQPVTGRTHQLRIHANKISHPIIGDHKYGNRHHNRMFEQRLGFENLFLHCKETSFRHPVTQENISINAPFPAFWEECLQQLQALSL
ncbi:pseudouridine synthase [Parvicella tangerina]|uniref:tRNA pseudouridine synthase C n=1 Tax=Parvicella tangerina TaxID=2829795 RepID=A0A916JM28_9FLAO|nr:pseudouridine synthase [Parvicella tangerina]CAG5080760.1 tRNA pseudouridine synthase C [Parvicella tangerina]